MKKPFKITLICVLVVVLLAGTTFTVIYFCSPKGQSRSEIEIVKTADNTYLNGENKDIANCSPMESLFILAFNLKNINSYYATVSGVVDAGITKQKVSGEKYKSGEEYLYVSRSTSFFKSTANRFFIENDAVLIQNKKPKTDGYEDFAARYSFNDYIKEYGTDFRELSNYELNENTIINAEFVSVVDGIYTFNYEIDAEKGVEYYRVNMYKMGDLSALPTFKKSKLKVEMTGNFLPVSITQTDEYSVNMGFTVSCKSELVEKFEKVNDSMIVIPEREFFRSQLGGV